MSKNKSSSITSWDNFSEKIESLREALNNPVVENDSYDKSAEKSDDIIHFTEEDNKAISLGTFDIEALREVLNTPIDEIIASDTSHEKSDLLFSKTDQDAADLVTTDNETIVSDEEALSIIPDLLADTVDMTESVDETEMGYKTDPEYQIQETDDSDELDVKQESQDIKEDTDTSNENDLLEIIEPDTETRKTDEPDELEVKPEIQDIEEYTDTSNERDLLDIVEPDTKTQETDESDELEVKQESQDRKEDTDTSNEKDLLDVVEPDAETHKTDESSNLDDDQESHDVSIKINTVKSVKTERIDNYWKQGETPNPYLLKVDESRERLNKSLEMARELVNRQSEEPPKQEKKRFQLKFTRNDKNGNHKSNTGKGKNSKNTTEYKPMVYEMLEPKQEIQTNQPDQDYQDSQVKPLEQTSQDKREKGHKEKAKKSNDRVKESQEKEILNHRNRLEKSRTLGVPVFVKKPVNLEQIRQLKSMLTSQNDVKILVDTGSSQGRLLVISGQDPDTLLNTLSELPIVKSTTVEDETINIVL